MIVSAVCVGGAFDGQVKEGDVLGTGDAVEFVYVERIDMPVRVHNASGDTLHVDPMSRLSAQSVAKKEAYIYNTLRHRNNDGSIHQEDIWLSSSLSLDDVVPMVFKKYRGVRKPGENARMRAEYVYHGAGFVPSSLDLAYRASTPEDLGLEKSFQQRVYTWIVECFGHKKATNTKLRSHRFLEEALELVQTCQCTEDEAHQIVSYVFGRPMGDGKQEIGGSMVTLFGLCQAIGWNAYACGEDELRRCWKDTEKIRAKGDAKPDWSALPGGASTPEAPSLAVKRAYVLGVQRMKNTMQAKVRELAEKIAGMSVD